MFTKAQVSIYHPNTVTVRDVCILYRTDDHSAVIAFDSESSNFLVSREWKTIVDFFHSHLTSDSVELTFRSIDVEFRGFFFFPNRKNFL